MHPPLPDNFELCRKRLIVAESSASCRVRLSYQASDEPEVVIDPPSSDRDLTHDLPHHGVVRHDNVTLKIRIVYDASARTSGPSLNDCLYIGPSFGQSIFDILLQFRLHRVALAGDIEKALIPHGLCGGEGSRFTEIFVGAWHDPRSNHPEIHPYCIRGVLQSIFAECDYKPSHAWRHTES